MADAGDGPPRRERSRSRSRDRKRQSRSRDRGADRERRRSRSRSRERKDRRKDSRSRSRSKSPKYDPERKRRRPTWFDIPPEGGMPPPISQLPGAVQVSPAGPSSGPSGGGGNVVGGPNQQATRHARRIYCGGLPPTAREDTLASFFNNALAAVGGTTAGPGPCVVNVYINAEKKFSFIELRTVEETSNAMALDGIMFEGVAVRIRRPADYNAAAAASLGPSQPNPNLNLAAIGLDRAAAAPATGLIANATAPGAPMPAVPPPPEQQPGGSDRIFVGGLPYYLKIPECRELLGSFGAIRTFDLIIDRATGESKGYGFVVYEDPAAAEAAIAGLHGMKLGDRSLTVKKAEGQQRTSAVQPVMPAVPMAEGGYAPPMFTTAPPHVVKLVDALTVDELRDDEEYEEIMEDMRAEMGKYGRLAAVHIPRPPREEGAVPPPGLGRVVAEFEDPSAAMAARNALHGRKFGGRVVQASLMTEEDYKAGRWD